ncbi:hypothetical protein EH240_09580 [Mesorhizobium tamadayense]|uniref:Uncharacterized protein n=1 Tax=Mesorhizobium tamadayense TaxID=425306 RepID=A0A3P3FZ87_9HYPH|nr:hypothetical protein [Mesorhizobium tamadayense]RRI03940.1 hypothetical protein EH240_09580 [Mesorhizobium tamadayense]
MPVFDRAQELPRFLDDRGEGEWNHRTTVKVRGKPVFTMADGPTIEWRQAAQARRLTSNRYRGQLVADNQNWPLGKLLRAEGEDYLLKVAERYRDMHDAATAPHDLVGQDMADNVYLMADLRLDESTGDLTDKGVKKVAGRKARLDIPATRAVAADPDKTKRRAKPIPKQWNGDWPLLHHIDSTRELAAARSALGWLREAFEAAVCHGETLETIGRDHGVGNPKGAAGGGRALVFLGLQAMNEFWLKPARRAAAA